MEKLLQDIRYGTRSLVNAPRFTIAAVLTLALGMGANTAMFSVIQSVLLKPWPFQNPERLLYVSQRQADGNGNLFSTQDFLDWKQQGGLLVKMAADVSWQFNLSSIGSTTGARSRRRALLRLAARPGHSTNIRPHFFCPGRCARIRQLCHAQFRVMERPLQRGSEHYR